MPYAPDDALMMKRVASFKAEIAKEGWIADRTVDFDERWSTDDLAQVREAARGLVQGGAEVILTTANRVVPIVQEEAGSRPIVFVGIPDPVGQGLVRSLAHPGGSMTGFTHLEFDGDQSPLMSKLFELMLELSPRLRSAAIMFNPQNPAHSFHVRTFNDVAARRSITPFEIRIAGISDIDSGIADFSSKLDSVALLPSDVTLLAHRAAIVAAMARYRVPAIYSDRSFVEIGGLVSYAADRMEMYRRAAGYVSRILRGEMAGDLPVQQPTRYELVLNLRTARELGIDLPPALLARADEVIE